MDDFAFLISVLQSTVKYFELCQQYGNSIPDRVGLKQFLERRDEFSIFLSIHYIQELNKDISSEFLLYMLCVRNIIYGYEQIRSSFLTSDELEIVNIRESFGNELRSVLKFLKDVIFTLEISTSSKKELLSCAANITHFAGVLIPNTNDAFILLISYSTVLDELQTMCSCINQLHSNIEKRDWEYSILGPLEIIKAINVDRYLIFF